MNKIESRLEIKNDGTVRILFNDSWKEILLQNYENIELIGCGANAVTISGIHKITSRKDCIKIYTPNKSAGRSKVVTNQFFFEVRKIAALKDSHIVTVYDAYEEGDFHIVTMEYINGITLKEWLKKKTGLSTSQEYIKRLEIAKTTLETVLSYQKQGIIHGDLHLNNILVSREGKIFIIDFGTSYFSKRNNSQKRESYFVYDLVRKILGNDFDNRYFSVNCPSRLYQKKCSNDVRYAPPILVTRTMLAYINAMDILLQFSSVSRQDIVKFCVELTNGIYIDFDYAYKSFWRITGKMFSKKEIAHILFLNILDHISPDPEFFWDSELEKLQGDLLEIYYELTMKTKTKWNIGKAKEYTFSRVKVLCARKYDELMEKLLKASESTYYDFIGGTDYESEFDCCMKQIMSDALYVHYGSLSFAQIIWMRLNERRVKRNYKI